MIDMGGIPQRLKEHIGEAQNHQVLDRLLAEIMVDAENLIFAKGPGDRVIDGGCGIKVPANRLFDDDPGLRGDKPELADAGANIAEQFRPDGQVEGANPVGAAGKRRSQVAPALTGGGVERHIGNGLDEPFHRRFVALVLVDEFAERLAGHCPEFLVGQGAARSADHPAIIGNLTIGKAMIKRRQQLAPGQVAGAADDDVIERLNGDDAVSHWRFPDWRRAGAGDLPPQLPHRVKHGMDRRRVVRASGRWQWSLARRSST